jgi:hypothetical protein
MGQVPLVRLTFLTGSLTPIISWIVDPWMSSEPEENEELTEDEKFTKLIKDLKLETPVALPPAVYGTCHRCSVSLDMRANQGRCTVCGGPLRRD